MDIEQFINEERARAEALTEKAAARIRFLESLQSSGLSPEDTTKILEVLRSDNFQGTPLPAEPTSTPRPQNVNGRRRGRPNNTVRRARLYEEIRGFAHRIKDETLNGMTLPQLESLLSEYQQNRARGAKRRSKTFARKAHRE